MSVQFEPHRPTSPIASFLSEQAALRPASSTNFERQFMAALEESLARAGLGSGQYRIAWLGGESPAGGNLSGPRQLLVTIEEPQRGGSDRAQAVATEESASSDPVELLRSALAAAGLDPARFSLSEVREVVNNPGGSWVNHLIAVDFGGGLRENYDVGLMRRNVSVTVTEIRRLLSTPTST